MTDLVPPYEDARCYRQDVDRRLWEVNGNYQQTLRESFPHPMRASSAAPTLIGWWSLRYTTTTGGFVDAWITKIPILSHLALYINLPTFTTAGSTFSWRCRITNSVGAQLAVSGQYDQGVSVYRNWRMEWLHGLTLWTPDVWVAIQVNVTAITTPVVDVVDVFIPYGGGIAQRVPVRATSNGLLPGGL